VRFRKPVVYQERSRVESSEFRVGNRQFLGGGYVLLAKNEVGFQVAAYDPRKPLTIDPWSSLTYIGSSGTDVGTGIALLSNYYYVTGWTDSAAFPVSSQPYQSALAGGRDAFVQKAYSSTTYYTTYFGGSGDDLAYGIAVDGSGNASITGTTNSPNLPVKGSPAIQPWNNGGYDAFVTVLNPSGSGLIYSTYLGGSADDSAQGIVLGSGNAYLVGTTQSNNFPHTTGAYQTTFGGGTCGTAPSTYICRDAFVTVINSAGNALTYSTYLGGSGDDLGKGLALDAGSNVYVTGSTTSTDFPTTAGVVQPTCGTDGQCNGGLSDAFVSKLNPAASGAASLVYSTYLGGSNTDSGNGIAFETSNAYVTGGTRSTDFPVTAGVFQIANAGAQDAFVTKLDATASSRVYSTYLGGSGDEQANGIGLSGSNAWVIGQTESSNFPVKNVPTSYWASYGGNGDGFITKLGALGNVVIFSTYLAGSQADVGYGIAVLDASYCYAIATTAGMVWGGYKGGTSDAVVVGISGAALPILSLSPTSLTLPDTVVGSASSPLTVTLRNNGDAALSISSITINGDFTETHTCPGSLVPGDSCTISVTFWPAAVGTRTGTLAITSNDNGSTNTRNVPLSGRGTSAGVLSLSPNPLTFTGTPVGTTSSPLPVTVSNTGVGPLIISSFATTGPFGQTHNCPLSPSPLLPAASCTANVTFSPTVVGTSVGSLVVSHDAAGSPGSVVLWSEPLK
jgi:archaellum component FlaF (FlaF/FlaG flagellin family)